MFNCFVAPVVKHVLLASVTVEAESGNNEAKEGRTS
jgi:hypothetical protein